MQINADPVTRGLRVSVFKCDLNEILVGIQCGKKMKADYKS